VPPEEAFWSPYTGLDALCGNTLLISLDALVAAGLLARADLPPARPVADVDFPSARPLIELRCVLRSAGLSACLSACLSRPARVDHGPCSWLPATPGLTAGATAPCRIKGLRVSCRSAQVLEERTPLLRKAADAARAGARSGAAVRAWRGAHAWVEDSALFYCLTHFDGALRGVAWWQWPEPLRWGPAEVVQACSTPAARQGACYWLKRGKALQELRYATWWS